jgi:glycosyltransferase involved in cell wall biosynthesis
MIDMNVLLALHHAWIPNSGAPGVTIRLGDALRDAGCDVRFAFFDDVFKTVRSERTLALLYPWALPRYVHALRGDWRPDIVDVSTGDAWVMTRFRRRVFAAPESVAVITRSHGLEHVANRELRSEAQRRGQRLPLRYRAYHGGFRLWEVAESIRSSDRTILLNQGDRQFVETELKVPPERLSVLPLPLPLGFFGPANRAVPDREGATRVKIIFVGSWAARKGVDYLATALTQALSRGVVLDLTLAGTGLGEVEVLESLPPALRRMTKVIPAIENASIPDLLDAHDVFVLPSLSEGASVALSEAMARGLAVIATPVGAAVDYIQDGVDGLLVPTRDIPRLTEAVCLLAADADLRRRLGHGGQGRVANQRPDLVASQTIKLYEETIRSCSVAPGDGRRRSHISRSAL